MQTHMICYADEQMTISQQLCIKSAKEVGRIDSVYSFGPSSIDKFFYQRYKDTLDAPQRGGGKGYWLWKPYIVDETIRKLPDGDILIYCDSGIEWVNDFNHLLRRISKEKYEAENDIFLFSNGHRHIDWCKMDVLATMLNQPPKWDYVGQAYQSHKQVQASVIIMRVNPYTREFASKWLAWSCIPGFIDDDLRGVEQLMEFQAHRNDQSILTNLAILDQVNLHWWPAQYWQNSKANFPGDDYPQMFYHHRLRNQEWFSYYGAIPVNKMLEKFMAQLKNL